MMNPKRAKLSSRVDRISELPAHIRQHILSFLPTLEAIQTNTLSTTWRNDWLGIPCLNFGKDVFYKRYKDRYRRPWPWHRQVADEKGYLRLVSLCIPRRTTKIQKLQLFVPKTQHPFIQHDLASYAQDNSLIDEIQLDVELSKVPNWMLSSKIITKLRLLWCNLSRSELNEIKLPALVELDVRSGLMDQRILDGIIAGCPAIEKICLSHCNCSESIEINSGLPKLAHLKELEIDRCTNVVQLIKYLFGISLRKLSITYSRELDCADIDSCQNLRELRVRDCEVSNSWLDRHLTQLSSLQFFKLAHCEVTKRYKILYS